MKIRPRYSKMLTISVVIFVSRLIFACCDCPDDEEGYEYTYDSFIAFNLDNSGARPLLSGTDTIPKQAFGIRLQFALRQLAHNGKGCFSLFPKAYGMSCGCGVSPGGTARDTITSLTVTTLTEMDETHPANSDVTALFKVLENDKYVTVGQILKELPHFYHDRPNTEFMEMYLFNSSAKPGNYRFRVDITLSDQKQMSYTTLPVNLK
ncbi:DUF5034 domain-containing protein [Dyadobacter bucti]|uniref:DUF5034 domain-containing protein n=1 Tax=Dyadobacter bucti TaxID=2572203 RepID=UPI003F720946